MKKKFQKAKNNALHLISLCVIISFMNACTRGCSRLPTEDSLNHYCYVLCDKTKSIDTTNDIEIMRKLATEVVDAFLTAEAKGAIEYYSFGDNDRPTRLQKITIEEFSGMSTQKAKDSEDSIKRLKRQLPGLINYGTDQNTCITEAICAIINQIKQEGVLDGGNKVSIVVLSDMIEDCKASRLGKLDFTSKKNINETSLRLDSSEVSLVDLKTTGIRIYFSNISKHDNASLHQLYTGWERIFRKFGYSNGEFKEEDVINQQLPSHLFN